MLKDILFTPITKWHPNLNVQMNFLIGFMRQCAGHIAVLRLGVISWIVHIVNDWDTAVTRGHRWKQDYLILMSVLCIPSGLSTGVIHNWSPVTLVIRRRLFQREADRRGAGYVYLFPGRFICNTAIKAFCR